MRDSLLSFKKARADYVRAQDHHRFFRLFDVTKDERGNSCRCRSPANGSQRFRNIETAIAKRPAVTQTILRTKLRPVRKLLENLRGIHCFSRGQASPWGRRAGKHSSEPKLPYINPFVEFAGEIRCSARSVAECEELRARVSSKSARRWKLLLRLLSDIKAPDRIADQRTRQIVADSRLTATGTFSSPVKTVSFRFSGIRASS